MYKYLNWIVLVVLYLANGAIQAETLLEMYKLAEQHDPQFKIADAERLAVLERKPQAQALLLPQVNLSANVTERLRTPHFLTGDRFENTTAGYTVSLSYALYHHDREVLLKQADSQIKAAGLNYESAQQILMERVATRFFDVLAANDGIEFAHNNKKAIQHQLEQTRQRFEVGLIAVTDVQEAQAGFDLAVADEIQADNELNNAREALRETTGIYAEINAVLSEEAPLLNPNPENVNVWIDVALKENPQLLAAQFDVETAQQEIQRQRAAHSPTVDLVGAHSYNEVMRGEKNFLYPSGTDNSVSVQVSIPLYEGGAINSRVREAQQRHTQAIDRLDQQRRSITLQIRSSYLNVVSSISRVLALKQAVLSNRTALDATQTGFEVGTRTSVDVLNARREYLRAQRNYSRARYDYVLNTLRLKQAAGIIALSDLGALNAWLGKPLPEEVKSAPESNKGLEIRKDSSPTTSAPLAPRKRGKPQIPPTPASEPQPPVDNTKQPGDTKEIKAVGETKPIKETNKAIPRQKHIFQPALTKPGEQKSKENNKKDQNNEKDAQKVEKPSAKPSESRKPFTRKDKVRIESEKVSPPAGKSAETPKMP